MMIDTLRRFVEGILDYKTQTIIRQIMDPVYGRLSSTMLTTAGLVIHGSASALAKNGTLCYVIAKGQLRSIAANTDMAALVGSVTNAKFNVYVFFVDTAGALTSAMGVEGAALANVIFPPISNTKACIGFVIINPTGTGPFVGGTTALDDATVVPNAVYVNTPCGFDPQCLIS